MINKSNDLPSFVNENNLPKIVDKLSNASNIKITGNKYGNRVQTVIDKIVEKADDVTKAIKQEVVNDSYSFKVGTGDVDVSTDVEDGFGEVGVKGVTYQNLIPNLIDSRWKVGGSAIKDRTNLVNGVKLVITSEGSCVFDLNDISMFKPNTKYTLLVNIDTNFTDIRLSNILSSSVKLENGFNCVTFLTKSDFNEMYTCFRIGYTGGLPTGLYMTIKDLIVLEGDHTNNPNLPSYFEGIVGVGDKSKNLFNGELEFGGYTGSAGTPFVDNRRVRSKSKTFLSSGSYVVSCEKSTLISICEYNVDGTFIKEHLADSNKKYFELSGDRLVHIQTVNSNLLNSKIQLEKGSTHTEYQPYGTHKIEILSNGKNLISSKELSIGYFLDDTGVETSWKEYVSIRDYMRCPSNTELYGSYKYNGQLKSLDIFYYDYEKKYIKRDNGKGNITPSNAYYFRCGSLATTGTGVKVDLSLVSDIMVSNSKTREEFIPYVSDKTQILLDEPLMRLPNGVHDEITRDGKLIRKVGKIVLDGNEKKI